jgi:hypothetical protein
MQCKFEELARWAENATTWQLGSLQAAWCEEQVILLGERLPPLPGATRWWGNRILVPLGFRLDPDLAEGAVFQALGLVQSERAFLTLDGVEVLPADAFGPVSRAGVRLAARKRE